MTEPITVFSRRARRVVLACAAAVLASCGGEDPVDPGRRGPAVSAWRAGDGLLEEPEALRFVGWPEPVSSPAIDAALSALADDAVHVVEPEQFRDAGLVANSVLPRPLASSGHSWHAWLARAPISLDPGLGVVELRHRGKQVPLYPQVYPREVIYIDAERLVALRWRATTRELQVFSPDRPGRVELSRVRDSGRAERERWLRRDASPRGAPGVLGPRVHDGRLRTGLDVPAGAVLRTPSRRLLAERLEFAVSFEGEAWRLDRGVPVVLPQEKLPGVLAEWVLLHPEGETVVWSRRVQPGQDFVEERVELGAWRDRQVALELRLHADTGDAIQGLHVAGLRFAGGAERAPRRPHIVFLDIDTLRADRLGSYGNQPSPSPRLDAWAAAEATVYEDCIASSNWTLPSTISLLTGLDPAQHQLMTFSGVMSEAHAPLAVRLAAAGYETRARTDAGVVNPAFGFHHGFEGFDFLRLDPEEHERVGFEPELAWLAARDSERPAFLFLQTYMVHGPFRTELLAGHAYDGPLAAEKRLTTRGLRRATIDGHDAADTAYLLELYDAGIARMDALVGRTLDALPAIFGDEPYVVLITSDHGEELFDHADVGHANTLYQELVHVPLIVRYPDGRRPARVGAPTSALDVAPTLLELAGLPRPAEFSGRSLLEPQEPDRVRVATFERKDAVLDAVIWQDHKLIRVSERTPEGALPRSPTEQRLHDLRSDPREQRDLLDERTTERDALERALRRYREALPGIRVATQEGAPTLDAELRADLAALGYLDGG